MGGYGRRDKSPVDQARRLMSSLSNLEKETADSIWGSKEDLAYKVDINRGPAPLDQYLKYPETKSSPYPTLSDVKKKRHHDRPNLDDILEAKKVLRQLETTRETLEKNIDQVVRTSRDMHVFSALLTNVADGGASDHSRIERMVRKKIASLNDDVQREVLRGLAEEEAKKAATEAELIRLKNAMKKNPGRFENTKSRPARQFSDFSSKLATKGSVYMPPTTTTKVTRPAASKVKQPPKPTVIRDEKTMTRTYGKPEYQRGRTTIRDPYMHFQNAKKGKPAVMNESMVSRDGRSKSPKGKRQQSPVKDNQAPRQFYFSPTRGYIPLGANSTGPIPGEMVPMAIPLGEPRLEPGVRASAKPVPAASSNPITSTPVPVTAETKNAAVVSFLMDMKQKQAERREPELTKQVLPPIDIDSISPSSSRITDIQIRSPQQANPNVTFLQETHDSNLDRTITEDDYSDDEFEGEGIEFPGHDPKIPEYNGPDFPPQRSRQGHIVGDNPAEQPPVVSDVMAEDMRRKDVLENNAVNWLEQELMARVLTEVMPLRVHQNVADISEAQSEKSEASDKEESLLVADMIGQGGLQLFIDAGQPVDNRLVNILVAEVIQEKINAMLAHKELDPSQPRPMANDQGMGDAAGLLDGGDDRKLPSNLPRVPTPDPTPKTTPITSPRHVTKPVHGQAPVTPPQSPPADGFTFKKRPMGEPEINMYEKEVEEPQPIKITATPAAAAPPAVETIATANVPVEPESDSDITVSVDISEELRRVSAQGKKPDQPSMPVQVCHDVATPPISPLPAKEEEQDKPFHPYRQTTPPASPPPTQPQPFIIAPPSPQKQKREEPPVQEEESTEEEEEEEEEEQHTEPKKILTSVAVGDDSPMSTMRRTQERHRSPSPKREIRRSHSPTTDTMLSEESSVSESVNENISEGQWLLSRSEGQIVGIPGKVGLHDIKRGYQQMVDLSTASTLHDTEDLDIDMDTMGSKSEGEILVTGLPAPDQDPMLELLVQMQKNPRMAGLRDIPDSHIEKMVGNSAARNNMGRSLGEMSVGQVAPSRVIKVQSRQNGDKQRRGRGSPVYSPSASLDQSGADDYSYEERRGRKDRDNHQRHQRGGHQQRSPTPPQHRRHQEQPKSQGRSRTPDYAPRPQSPEHRRQHSPEHRRQHSPVHKSDSRDRSRKQMQYQPVLSEGAPMSTRRQQPRTGFRRSNERSQSADRGLRHSRESAASEPYTSNGYSVDETSRSLESASFRRSGDGMLTSSLKSRQSGVKKSVEFDLTGTYEQQRRESTRPRSSLSASRDSNHSIESSRLSDQSQSLGINYSYSLDDSVDDSELKRIVGTGTGTHTGPYRMSVTLPSTYGDDTDNSDYNM